MSAKRLVVKSQDHIPHLALLLGLVLGARIIQLQRDPTTCVFSLSSLFNCTHIVLSEVVQTRLIAEANMAMTAYFLRVNRQVRKNLLVDQAVMDVEYQALVDDPGGTVLRIYAPFDMDLSSDLLAKLSPVVRVQPRGKPQNHQYTESQFRLAEAETRDLFRAVEMEDLMRTPPGL